MCQVYVFLYDILKVSPVVLRYSHNLYRRWHCDCILVVFFWWWVQLVTLDPEEWCAAMIGWCSTPVIGTIAPLSFCFNFPSEIRWGTLLRLLWRCIRSLLRSWHFHRDIRLFKGGFYFFALGNNQFLLPLPLFSASRFVTARTWQWSPW